MIRRHAVLVLTLLAFLLAIPALRDQRSQLSPEQQAYQRPLTQLLDRTFPGSEIHVLSTRPLRLVGTINAGPNRRAQLESSLRTLLNPDQCLLLPGHAPWRPLPETLWAGVTVLAAFPVLRALRNLGARLLGKFRPPGRRLRQACCFSPAVLAAGVLCLGWPLWTLLPGLVGLLACLPRRVETEAPVPPSRQRLREASVILMSYPPDFYAQCLGLLKLEHMQALKKVISKLPPTSAAEKATILAEFSVETMRVRQLLGVHQSTQQADPALVARVLEERYLVNQPTFTPRAGSPRRRKIYSCPACDEVFIDEESLRRHETTHVAPPRLASRRQKGAAVLLVLAAATTAIGLNYRTSTRLVFPGARPVTALEQQALTEIEQVFPHANLLLLQGPGGLVLAAPARVQPFLNANIQTLSVPPRQTWKWMVGIQLVGALLLLARRPAPSARLLPVPVSPPPIEPEVAGSDAQGPMDDVTLELGTSLVGLIDPNQSSKLNARCVSLRKHLAQELGLPLGLFRFRDNLAIGSQEYLLRVRGVEMGRGSLRINQFLAIGPLEKLKSLPGELIEDPTYALPGKWIGPERRGDSERLGCMLFDPVSVLATQLTVLLRQEAGRLLAYDQVCALLDHERYQLLVEALAQRGIDRMVIWRVLRLLLDERVSIRDLLTILEGLAENCHLTQDPELLTELVRQALGSQLSAAHANELRCLPVLTMDLPLEQMLDRPMTIDEEREWMTALIDTVGVVQERGLQPVLLCSPDHRREARRRLVRACPQLVVLSWNEIAPGYTVNSVAMAQI